MDAGAGALEGGEDGRGSIYAGCEDAGVYIGCVEGDGRAPGAGGSVRRRQEQRPGRPGHLNAPRTERRALEPLQTIRSSGGQRLR